MEANVFEDLLGVLAEEHSIDPYSVRMEALRLYLNANPSLKLERKSTPLEQRAHFPGEGR